MNYLHATIKGSNKAICFNVDQIIAVHDYPSEGKGTTIYAAGPDNEFQVNESYDSIMRALPLPK